VAGTDIRCSDDASRNAATQSFQKRDGSSELPVRIPRDVLAEETRSPAVAIDFDGALKKESLVCCAKPATGDAVGLAGISGSDAMNASKPWSSVEGGKVRPDRRRSHLSCFHTRDQCSGRIGFPLHVSDAARAGSGKLDAEFEAPSSGAEGEGVVWFGT